ncbi:hypothetical protein MHA_2503 [Mannheimia haemolytica PHL213]|nr:hypothetical protein MHA_2503 [Mannheimia haemolytica PHL213]
MKPTFLGGFCFANFWLKTTACGCNFWLNPVNSSQFCNRKGINLNEHSIRKREVCLFG